MKIAIVQARPATGDIAANVSRHLELIDFADGADIVIFPELSLTGYEPALAKTLSLDPGDSTFSRKSPMHGGSRSLSARPWRRARAFASA